PDALPDLFHSPGVQGQPIIHPAPTIGGHFVGSKRLSLGARRTFLSTQSQAVENAAHGASLLARPLRQAGEKSHNGPAFVIRGTPANGGRGEHAAASDVLQ